MLQENTYDELNRLKTEKVIVTNVDGVATTQITSYAYDKNGNQLTEADWRNNVYTNVYDGINRLIEKRDPYAAIQKLQYNHNNAQVKSYDGLNHLTQYSYDKNNRQLSTTDASNHITSQTYDDVGNIVTKTDGRGNKLVADGLNHTTSYQYNEFNKLTKVTNPKNEVTQYTYDLSGNKLTQTDGRLNTITYEYNAANKVKKRIDQGGRTGVIGSFTYKAEKIESYTYFSNGNVKTKVDRNGKTTSYQYNVLGNTISESVGTLTNSYTYDKNGNQLTVVDSTGTTSRTYDELNRVTKKNVPSIGETKFKYDITTARADMPKASYAETATDAKGNITTKVYDKTSKVTYVLDGDINSAISAAYDYNSNGSKKSVLYSGGAREDYTYFANSTLMTLVNKKADGSTLETFSYEYDEANNQIKKTDIKRVTNYIYDELNRLDTVSEPLAKSTKYQYDMAGNRTVLTISQNGTVVLTNSYSYNEQNRLMLETRNEAGKVNTIPYTYDNNGNLLYKGKSNFKPIVGNPQKILYATIVGETESDISKDVSFYEYDDLNRLVKVEAGAHTNTYVYNGEGLRVGKTIDGQTTRYMYEGDKVTLEVDASGNEKARNIYGTNLISRKVTGVAEKYYYMYNGHGDVTALTDGGNQVFGSYYYDAFGVLVESTGNVDNSITYSGYQYDKETGLYYLNARMYDPTSARFLQEDTYLGDHNDPLSLNLYTYCSNSPLIYSDPSGHMQVIDNEDESVTKYFASTGHVVYGGNSYMDEVYKMGSKGDGVKKLQEMLTGQGYSVGGADGIFGKKTYQAVI